MNNSPLTALPVSRAVSELGIHAGTLTTITLWHDFLCPWCYVGLIQAEKLIVQYDVSFDWRGAELFPPALAFTPPSPKSADPDAPAAPPSQFDKFVESEGIVMPPRPPFLPMHNALLAAEYATVTHGADAAHTFIAALYRGYWEKHEDISDHDVLQGYAEAQGLDAAPLLASVAKDEFVANILDF
ncbi:MAG: DsbA family protein, partial [Armatimonadetes bacterium]|nr:DsbA family protein [Armatimonadota bacterium]